MKLYEYQARELFEQQGIKVPESALYEKGMEFEPLISRINLPCMVKAQILQGGRGKAGFVKMAHTTEEVKAFINDYETRNVHKVLLAEAIDVDKELYLSITVDAPEGKALILACADGGVDIEELALTQPEKIIRETVDIRTGLLPFLTRDIAYRLNEEKGKEISSIILKMYKIFVEKDAELVEINPLFITTDGDVVAGDGKVSIDDSSTFRQTRYKSGRDYYDSDAEYEAAEEGIPYLQFDGDISLMCAGAGLTTAVYDLINYEGGDHSQLSGVWGAELS